MDSRYFIEDIDIVKKFLRKLTPSKEPSDYERELYIDKETNQKWEKYSFENVYTSQDSIGLRKFPYPETAEVIKIALTSPYLDEVEGASALLVDQEDYDDIEFREQLITAIENIVKEIDKERYEIIYNRAELYDRRNRREILWKHYKEIEKDAKHYREMSERAEDLKRITADNMQIKRNKV